jgi:hypothetical protein
MVPELTTPLDDDEDRLGVFHDEHVPEQAHRVLQHAPRERPRLVQEEL